MVARFDSLSNEFQITTKRHDSENKKACQTHNAIEYVRVKKPVATAEDETAFLPFRSFDMDRNAAQISFH
jgi:hypothetical protein